MVPGEYLLAATYVLSGLLPLVFLRPTLDNWGKPGASGFLLLLFGIALWSFSSAVLTLPATAGLAFVAFIFRLTGGIGVAVGYFLLVAEYTGALNVTRAVLGGTFGLVLTKVLIEWTNPLHHLVFGPDITITGTDILVAEMGPFFVVHMAASYLLVGLGVLLITGEVVTTSGLRRQQSLGLLVGATPVIALNVLSMFLVPISFDPTPLGFIPMAFILGWVFFDNDFLKVVPVGRRQAVDSMDDPVVVIDDEGWVVDTNPAARAIAGVDEDWKTMPAAEFFAAFPESFDWSQEPPNGEGELSMVCDGRQRHFDPNVSPIRGPHGEQRGRLVVLRDVTLLKEREQELDLMRQVQSRILRHNIRNDLQTVKLNNELLADRLDGEAETLAREALGQTEELVTISTKARTVGKLLERDQTPVRIDMCATLRTLLNTYRDEFPTVEFSLDAPDSCPVTANPAIELALENIVENAAEHNDAPDPSVDVTVTAEDGTVTIVISDNGPGIPQQELSVLERGQETALQHGSGVGLWIVHWAIDNSTASISYDSDEEGTDITVRIPN